MSSNWLEKYKQHHKIEDQQELNELETIFRFSDLDHKKVDEDQAWNSVYAKIQKPRTQNYRFIWRVAAILLLVGGLTFTVLEFADFESNNLTEVITETATKKLQLPDGSIITMAAGSELSFDSDNFLSNRSLKLEGEAFFEVTRSSVPFTVTTVHADISVLGTSFNVQTDAQQGVKLFVESGLVAFKSAKEEHHVSPGELAIASKEGEIKVAEDNDPNRLSWKTGKFTFENTELKEAFTYLEKYYKVPFNTSQDLENCTITADFNKQRLTEVVDILATILNAKGNITSEEVLISGQGCK